MLKRLKKLAFALVGTVALCGSMSAEALNFGQINHIYFFGDSLTDSGFNDLVARAPGKAPTFTTYGGYIYSQYLARDIKGYVLPIYPGPTPPDTITNNAIYFGHGDPTSSGTLNGIDYAAGGSTTGDGPNGILEAPNLIQQVNYYLSTAPARLDPRDLYFVWSGANDLLILLNGPTMPTQLQLLTAANTAANNIGLAISALANRGARRIVVMSLPNIGYTPAILEAAAATNMPQLPAQFKTVTFAFNSMLNTQLGKVIKRYGTKILYEDVYDLLDNVIAATKAGYPYVVAGQTFKFTNYNAPACGLGVSALECPNNGVTGYIFADTLHPTDEAHRLLSLQIEQDILAWN